MDSDTGEKTSGDLEKKPGVLGVWQDQDGDLKEGVLVDTDSIMVYKKIRNGYVPAADLPVPVENAVTYGVVFLKF